MFLSYRNHSVDLLANQLNGFYMMRTLVVKGLTTLIYTTRAIVAFPTSYILLSMVFYVLWRHHLHINLHIKQVSWCCHLTMVTVEQLVQFFKLNNKDTTITSINSWVSCTYGISSIKHWTSNKRRPELSKWRNISHSDQKAPCCSKPRTSKCQTC